MKSLTKYLLFVVFLLVSIPVDAQIAVGNDEFGSHISLSAIFVDKENNTPIVGVSFYITSPRDSAVLGYTISDNEGKAVLEHVTPNLYDIYVEMLGYKPLVINRQISETVDMGVLQLELDPKQIDPASIQTFIKPMEVRGDTVIYNASAFPVMENAVLEDLIKKMPGLTLEEDGSVFSNGKPIKRITIGGRTFFFDDPSLVIKSLPARVVEKILIMDEDNRELKFSGLSSVNAADKVMDIKLKDEFMKGLFGRVSIGAGRTINGEGDDFLESVEKALFNVNAMASISSDLDQITVIGLGNNDGTQNGGTVVGTNNMDEFDSRDGLVSAVKTGINYNTTRLKGLDSNASISYYFDHKDVADRSVTELKVDESKSNVYSREYIGEGNNRMISANMNIINLDASRYNLTIRPVISYSEKSRGIRHTSSGPLEMAINDELLSSSNASALSGGIQIGAGIRSIGGKRGRNLNFSGNAIHNKILGNELRLLSSSDGVLNLKFDSDGRESEFAGQLSYSEPLSDSWVVQMKINVSNKTNRRIINAEDVVSQLVNDYYSSDTKHSEMLLEGRVLAQYRRGLFYLTFGPIVDGINNKLRTFANGQSGVSSDFKATVSPYANLGWSNGSKTYSAEYDGHAIMPLREQMQPTIDVVNNATNVLGNIYLLPSYVHSLLPVVSIYTEKNLMLFVSPGLIVTTRPTTVSSWTDVNGDMNIMPVNALKPKASYSLSTNMSKTFGKKYNWSAELNVSSSYSPTISYQAFGLPSIDVVHMDYLSVMKSIWGDPSGSVFYNGKSGFRENKLLQYTTSTTANLMYRNRSVSVRIGGSFDNSVNSSSMMASNISWCRYDVLGSLTWNNRLFQSSLGAKYQSYLGSVSAFAKPECIVNVVLSKDIKGVSLSIRANDLLNQHRSYLRDMSGNMIGDRFSNVLGRTFIMSASFHFGSPNAKAGDKASEAVQNISYYR